MSTPTTPSAKGTRATETHRWTLPLAIGLVLLYLAAAWTIDAVRRLPSNAQLGAVAVVTFASGSSYTDALSELTSIGMRLSSPCFEGAIQSGDQVIDELRAQQESFSGAGQRQVVVATTVLTPVDWVEHIWTMPGVTGVDTRTDFTCPAISGSNLLGPLLAAPPAERPVVLAFPSGMAYGEALRAATDVGLRLADPCYEAALARGDHPAWHPASQEQAYGSSRSLVVAPTILTPADWLNRLASGITPGPVVGCASS